MATITITNVPKNYSDDGTLKQECQYGGLTMCVKCKMRTDCLNSGEVAINYDEMIQNSGFTFAMKDILVHYLFYDG